MFDSAGQTAISVETINSAAGQAVMISGKRAKNIESLSPEGWCDCSDANIRRWTLLAGTSTAIDTFNIAAPVVPKASVEAPEYNIHSLHNYLRTEFEVDWGYNDLQAE